jgi:hypothetical protein
MRTEQVRRREPVKTPDWVNRMTDRIADVLIEGNYYQEGEVWGLAKRGCYDKSLLYEELGSLFFYNTVSEFSLWNRFPKLDDQARQKALRFWQNWQDPKTGQFKDPRDPKREVNEKYVIELIAKLGGKPLYPRGKLLLFSTEKIDPTIFLQRSKEDTDWARGGWGVGSYTGFAAAEILEAINAGQTDLIPALEKGMEQILAHQNPESGMWGPATAPLKGQLGGALKVISRFYYRMGLKSPHIERLADSLIKHEQNGDWHRCGKDICVPVNVVSLVVYCLEASDYRRDDLLGVLESKAEEYREWVDPDDNLLLRRGDHNSVGYEACHISGLRVIALYLHWSDCRLLTQGFKYEMTPQLAGFRYRPFLQADGKVKVVDTQENSGVDPANR